MINAFDTSIRRLESSPYLGAALPDRENGMIANGYRYLVFSPYMIFCRVCGNEIRIGRILHSRQDWPPLLFGQK